MNLFMMSDSKLAWHALFSPNDAADVNPLVIIFNYRVQSTN
jgi:hypothetical protein